MVGPMEAEPLGHRREQDEELLVGSQQHLPCSSWLFLALQTGSVRQTKHLLSWASGFISIFTLSHSKGATTKGPRAAAITLSCSAVSSHSEVTNACLHTASPHSAGTNLNFCRLLPLKPLPALEMPFDTLNNSLTPHTQVLSPASRDTSCTSTANKQKHNESFSPPWSWRWDAFLITGYLEGFISSDCLNTQMTASIRDRQQRRKAIYLLSEGNADVRHRQPGWDCQELRFLPKPSYLTRGIEQAVKKKLHSASQAGLACIYRQTESLWFHPFLSQGLSTCCLHKTTGPHRPKKRLLWGLFTHNSPHCCRHGRCRVQTTANWNPCDSSAYLQAKHTRQNWFLVQRLENQRKSSCSNCFP